MIDIIRKLFPLFSPQDRRKIMWLFFFIILMALFSVIGVASITPFMAVVSNPTVIESNKYFHWLYQSLGFQSNTSFLLVLGVLVFVALIGGNAFSAFTTWRLLRFSEMESHSFSIRLLKRYLSQPYEFFLNKNSSEVSTNLLSEVGCVVSGVLLPFIQLIAYGVVSVFVVILLFVADPLLAFITALVLGGAYSLIYSFIRRRLAFIGKRRVELNNDRYKIISEAFGGIKDVKLCGKEQVFLDIYSNVSKEYSYFHASHKIMGQLPRYVLESIAFGGVLLIILYLIAVRNEIKQIIPIIALYAFAGYRLMPALQNMFSSITSIKFNKPSLDILVKEFKIGKDHGEVDIKGSNERIPIDKNIEIKDISFQYNSALDHVIKDLSIDIKARTTVGIVGATGSGKTTLIDVILGLLRTNVGELFVDGKKICAENLRLWQNNVGYVPQHIYLCDDTITHNIAFGVPTDKIDMNMVKRAAQIANIDHFITNELPKSYDTVVGERGVRLSGGQRQRIGIARALYNDPPVLILDEATSSLDGITEDAVMEAIHNLSHKKTIVLIAHRLTTVRECDIIYLLENGQVSGFGKYDDLLESSPRFRAMAKTMPVTGANVI